MKGSISRSLFISLIDNSVKDCIDAACLCTRMNVQLLKSLSLRKSAPSLVRPLSLLTLILALFTLLCYQQSPRALAQAIPLDYRLQSYLPVDDDTLSVAIGDLNRDGNLDMVIGNRGQNVLYLNNGRGVSMKQIFFGGAEATTDLAVGDLNGDGLLDIIAYNVGAPSIIYQGDGLGNFVQQESLTTDATVGDRIVLADIDGDGDYDLIAAAAQTATHLYRNDGQGRFTQGQSLTAALDLQLIDDDGDGDLDLYLLRPDNTQLTRSSLYRYRNNGQGQFNGGKVSLPGGKALQQRFLVADLDGDGDMDFVISSITAAGCSGSNCENLRLLLDRGLLGYASINLDNAAASDLALVDLDHDGDQDIVAAGLATDVQTATDQQSRVYLNDGMNALLQTASFTKINVGSAQIETRALAVADLNNDGLLDLLFGSGNTNALYHSQMDYFFGECKTNLLLIDPYHMADFNGDGYQDLLLRSGLILANDKRGNFVATLSLSLLLEAGSDLATADLNGDGLIDLVATHQARPAVIHLQLGSGQFAPAMPLPDSSYPATSVAIGDINSDGALDIIVGRGSSSSTQAPQPNQNYIYFNRGDASFGAATPLSTVADNTLDVALGDLDADGDLDLVVANGLESAGQQQGQQNYLYWNDGSGGFGPAMPLGPGTDRSSSIAIGDLNGNGQLDLVIGNRGQPNTIFYNEDGSGFTQAQTLGQLPDNTGRLLLVDMDQDRDLDLMVSNEAQPDALYLNDGDGGLLATPAFAEPSANVHGLTIAAADLDHDGDIDLVSDLQARSLLPNLTDCVMPGRRAQPVTASARLPQLHLAQPGHTVNAGPYASPQLFAQAAIPFTFSLFDPEAKPVDIQAFYSLNGGGQWLPAQPTTGTQTKGLATRAGQGPATHTFAWDVYGSNFLGHSDNVVLRIEAKPTQQPGSGTVAGPFAHAFVAAETFPLRARGTQVRVINEAGEPVPGALLYRLPTASTERAETFPLRNGVPVRTNPLGFIESRGQLNPGDQLVALQPISATHAFTLYHTSAAPTQTGLDAYVVQAAGIQTLTVSAANPLALFRLRLALEWDARNDGTFLADLENAIQHASAVLYDVTDGQVALGDVTVHQGKDLWGAADVTLYASNSVHPRATMGGIVITPTAESGINGVIPSAYWPGQVHMGPAWDPFGENAAELRQDWWLAFAHELAHYYFFLPDNYLGIENGVLRKNDCQGSFMTNTYEETYQEFLTRDRWDAQPACAIRSIAAHTTGRSDWETLQHFLPWLQVPANADAVNPGPYQLPLQVTRIQVQAPRTPSNTPVLPAHNFDLRDNTTGEVIRVRQAEAYLIKTRSTAELEDDEVISLGSTGAGSDRIKVRGAEVGDRLCVFQGAVASAQVGCETVSPTGTSIRLQPVTGWAPDITVTPVNSTTLTIRVSQNLEPGQQLRVQVLPADRETGHDIPATAPWSTMQRISDAPLVTFEQTVTLDMPIFEGFLRVWVADSLPAREAISHIYLSPGWGPNVRPVSHVDRRVWGPNVRPVSHANQRGWGANGRSMEAPIASGDGKVTIFNVDDVLGESGASALQSLSTYPQLPLWVTAVGKGYRFIGTQAFNGTIAFNYLEREVPKGYEHTLTVYYLANPASVDGVPVWQRLITDLDTDENMAAARMPADSFEHPGTFVLAATVEMPQLTVGWNQLGYPIPGVRSIETALASIADAYTSVYAYDSTAATPWQLYDSGVAAQHPTYAPWVNDLQSLRFGHTYWLYATKAITPYLGVGTVDELTAAEVNAPFLPPATLFGPLASDEPLIIGPDAKLVAMVDETVCGEGVIRQVEQGVQYKIQVLAAEQNNGCGVSGALITLQWDNRVIAEQPLWDHRWAQYQPLTVTSTAAQLPADQAPGEQDESRDSAESFTIFLPLLQR